MEVGLAAAKAIKGVHGMDYTVGTSPNVLCKYKEVAMTRQRPTDHPYFRLTKLDF